MLVSLLHGDVGFGACIEKCWFGIGVGFVWFVLSSYRFGVCDSFTVVIQ